MNSITEGLFNFLYKVLVYIGGNSKFAIKRIRDHYILRKNIKHLSLEEHDYIREWFWDKKTRDYRAHAVEIGSGILPVNSILQSLVKKKIVVPISYRSPSQLEIPLIAGITVYKNSIITCNLDEAYIKVMQLRNKKEK